MAGTLPRRLPLLLNTTTPHSLGFLKTHLGGAYNNNSSLTFAPRHSSGSGSWVLSTSANLLLMTCRRHKSGSGGPLSIGSSTGKKLYEPLQFGKQSKKFKRKQPKISLAANKIANEIRKPAFVTAAPLVNTSRMTGSFLPSLTLKTPIDNLSGMKIVQTSGVKQGNNLKTVSPSVRGESLFIGNEVSLWPEKKEQERGSKRIVKVHNNQQSNIVKNQSRKNKVSSTPINSKSGPASQESLNRLKDELNAIRSNKETTGLVLVTNPRQQSHASDKPVNQNKAASKKTFHKELNDFISGFQTDPWEQVVQKSLQEQSKNSSSTSFILVDDIPARSDRHVFVDPRHEMESHVFGQGNPSYQSQPPSTNISRVPNNTAKLGDNLGVIETNASKQRVKKNKKQLETGPELSIYPSKIRNTERRETQRENKQKNRETSSLTSNDYSRFGSSLDFYNKSIWSKELLAAVERTQNQSKLTLHDRNIKSIRTEDQNLSTKMSDEVTSFKKLDSKRSKKELKSKEKAFYNNVFRDSPLSNRNQSNIPVDMEYKASQSKRIANGTGYDRQGDLLRELREQWKGEFTRELLQAQNQRSIKERPNPKSNKPTLVHTPNSFAAWLEDTEGEPRKMTNPSNKRKTGQSKAAAGNKEKETKKNSVIMSASGRHSGEPSRVEQQIRDITGRILKNSTSDKRKSLSRRVCADMGNSMIKDCENRGNLNKNTYYVLADEKLEDLAKERDQRFYSEALQKQALTGSPTGLSPLLDKMDGFMTMTLIPVHDSPQAQNKPEGQSASSPSFKARKMTPEQQMGVLRKNHELLEKNRLLRNMLAMRRFQDQQQREKVEKQKKKKRGKKRNGTTRSGPKQQRESVENAHSQ